LTRLPRIHHCTSHAHRFFGREAELALLREALGSEAISVVALIGQGGQGKTAIVQHWLEQLTSSSQALDGLFFWSFYRGKDSDLCLRDLFAYAEGHARPGEHSATYCVDRLLPRLRCERWAVILDGVEVVQHETEPWFGRFVHPELGRLVEELASAPRPGVLVLTTRFAIPGLTQRTHARSIDLAELDSRSAVELLRTLGLEGTDPELAEAVAVCGGHAKAVELLGTYLTRFRAARADAWRKVFADGPELDDERRVARVLNAFQADLPQELQDLLALSISFREPLGEPQLREYLAGPAVVSLLHEQWQRTYVPFPARDDGWLKASLQELVDLRLLERVAAGHGAGVVIDAHPLIRRAFEHVLGPAGRHQSALARAGFLRGRPDRRRAESLDEARESVELFHAHCEAGLWNEADGVYVALENPKHRFLAPAFERDLLLRFFPQGDWRQPPLWPGFGRYRSLAICFELLGEFESALECYRGVEAPLQGDALLALGRLNPLLDLSSVPQPWQSLWGAYRAHALCLAGRVPDALAQAASLVPVDIYEWVHVFECCLRSAALARLDVHSMRYRPPLTTDHAWADLARPRLQPDYQRIHEPLLSTLEAEYRALVEAYDRAGLPFERTLTRLSLARFLLTQERFQEVHEINAMTLAVARRHRLRILEVDAVELEAEVAETLGRAEESARQHALASALRNAIGYRGPRRP